MGHLREVVDDDHDEIMSARSPGLIENKIKVDVVPRAERYWKRSVETGRLLGHFGLRACQTTGDNTADVALQRGPIELVFKGFDGFLDPKMTAAMRLPYEKIP